MNCPVDVHRTGQLYATCGNQTCIYLRYTPTQTEQYSLWQFRRLDFNLVKRNRGGLPGIVAAHAVIAGTYGSHDCTSILR
jgi:hypothetical protein